MNPDTALRQLPADEPVNPLRLIDKAVSNGYGTDQLKVLFDLYNAVTAGKAKQAFHEAMAAAQGEMPTVVATAKNTQTGSTYADLASIQHRCRPIWMKHGFTLSFGQSDCPREGWIRTVCDVRHVAGHAEKYHKDLPVDGIGPKGNPIGGMNAVQGAASTSTYAQRYLTCDIWDIVIADTDLDGSSPVEPITAEQVAELERLIEETRSDRGVYLAVLTQKVSLAFNTQADLQSLAELPRPLFAEAYRLLQEKARKLKTGELKPKGGAK